MNHEFINQKFIDKFTKLRFRISFKARESHTVGELEVINDMDWVKRKIEYLVHDSSLTSADFHTANRLWKKYSNTEIPEDDDGWEYIDLCLKDNRKIQAIKTYRQLHNCGLREAKEAIDERQRRI